MYKSLTLFCIWLISISQLAYGQQRTIKGTVVEQKMKTPIVGATVRLEGTQTATSTDESGAFTIEVPSETATLNVSIVGYVSTIQTVTPQDQNIIISLAQENERIDDVVVTALGIQRKAKSLSYS